jgi:hypothetical protein
MSHISVSNGSPIPFPIGPANPNPAAPGTNISVPALGTIEIADTGWYQVTFGFMTTASNAIFDLETSITLVSGYSPVPFGPNLAIINSSTGLFASNIMQGLTLILQVTTNPTYIQIINTTGGSVTLENGSGSGCSSLAYITIVKISN